MTTPSTELHSSIIVVTTIERAFNLDTCKVCSFLGGDIERRTECREVQIRHFLIELSGKRKTSLSAWNRHNHPVTTGLQNALLRLAVVDFHAFQALQARECINPVWHHGAKQEACGNTTSRGTDGHWRNLNSTIGLKPTRLHGDQRGGRKDILRLDAVDFHASQAL